MTVNAEFKVHVLNEQGIEAARSIAAAFDTLLNDLALYCETGREFAIARTKLEEACFFAKKAMATKPLYQKVSEG